MSSYNQFEDSILSSVVQHAKEMYINMKRMSASHVLLDHELQDLTFHNPRIEEQIAYDIGGKIISLICDMPIQKLGIYEGSKSYKVPSSWIQMLKEEHAPKWVKRRWPVKYIKKDLSIKVDVSAAYPECTHQFNGLGPHRFMYHEVDSVYR